MSDRTMGIMAVSLWVITTLVVAAAVIRDRTMAPIKIEEPTPTPDFQTSGKP